MKKLSVLLLLLGVFSSIQPIMSWAEDPDPTDEACKCGADEDGECLPCKDDGN